MKKPFRFGFEWSAALVAGGALALTSVGCAGSDEAPASDGVAGAPSASPSVGVPVEGAVGPSGNPDPSVPGTADPTGVAPGTNPGTVGPGGEVPGTSGVPTDPGTSTPGSSPGAEAQPPAFEAHAGMLRRLTRTQFRNAVRDIFDVEVDVGALDADSWTGNFAVIGAASVVTSERGVEQYHAAIEAAVDTVFSDGARRESFIGCDIEGAQAESCLRGYLENLGLRAWRRPLDSSELDLLNDVANTATVELGSAVEGARWATVAMFVSPNFLYRAELGEVAPDGTHRFTGYEMASRLSFLLWNSLPDAALLEEAANGSLATAEGVRAAALRMLEASSGRESIGAFAEEYMRLDRVRSQAKDASLFPEYGPALQAAMVEDMRETWESVAFDDGAGVVELFTTPKVVVNAELAELYGLDAAGLDSNAFVVRALPDGDPRIGILGKAAFLSQFANQKEGSPTLRGKFMRDALMCTQVPPPPGDVTAELEETPSDAPMTKRQRLEQHSKDPSCALCHGLMDPLGLPFETFDAIGRHRTTEAGLVIDPSGDFEGTPVADAREMSFAVASSEVVADCLVQRYYSYAMGHERRAVDEIVIRDLSETFRATNFNLRELVVGVVTHPAFSSVAPQL